MMIKRVFSDLISNPENLNQVRAEEIVEVLDEFPYCQIAHLLMAKKLKQDDSMLFEKQLNLSAAYAPSRKILHDLIQGSAIVSSDQTEVIPEIRERVEKKVEDDIIKQDTEKIVSTEDQELDDLLQSEIQSTYDLSQIPPLEKKKEDKAGRKINENEKHQFSDWIRYIDGKPLREEKDVEDIIDKFIEDEPRIGEIKPPQEIYENLAKVSSDELDHDLVTETLAKIHIDQGNKLMAIEIYELLILKYPEKRPYFAAQINFIKK